jgi:hypothetical protein
MNPYCFYSTGPGMRVSFVRKCGRNFSKSRIYIEVSFIRWVRGQLTFNETVHCDQNFCKWLLLKKYLVFKSFDKSSKDFTPVNVSVA